jgi:hypothetical protein
VASRTRAAWRHVEHEPKWRPALLPTNAAGDTRPGFYCVHLLENGNGQCGATVFHVEDAIGSCGCFVRRERSPRSRMRAAYRRRRR